MMATRFEAGASLLLLRAPAKGNSVATLSSRTMMYVRDYDMI
jgi:hypothetical protein